MLAGYIGSLSMTRFTMSFIPAPPRIQTFAFPASLRAFSTPRAMSSSCAHTASNCLCFTSIVCITSKAFCWFHIPLWLSRILIPVLAKTAFAASTRSVFTVHGMPSSTKIDPLLFSFLAMNSADICPNFLLSPAKKMSAIGSVKPRSTFTIKTPSSFSFLAAGVKGELSVARITSASIFLTAIASRLWICLSGLSAVWKMNSTSGCFFISSSAQYLTPAVQP